MGNDDLFEDFGSDDTPKIPVEGLPQAAFKGSNLELLRALGLAVVQANDDGTLEELALVALERTGGK